MSPPLEVDVLIAGSGSAGLAAATWLSIYGIPPSASPSPSSSLSPNTPSSTSSGGVIILEKRPTPLAIGQADGVQCRTVEIFESFSLSEPLLKESYHVIEVSFWRDEGDGDGLMRRRRTMDTEKGLSWCPHVILNQARVNGLLEGKMAEGPSGGLKVHYGWEVTSLSLEPDGERVRVSARQTSPSPSGSAPSDEPEERTFLARYVLACDGAHSSMRRSLDYKMVGDSSDAVWGVMDVYPVTNFPDIRKKAALHNAEGALLLIPREGGSLVRFYIELPPGTVAKEVTLEGLKTAAKKMFGKYDLEIADTYWWSAYSIGQRVAERFSMANRVFLMGDACHTHSPKAGQGMNVSLQDGYNIGWKLGMVLRGMAGRELLETYDSERGKVARDLIDFDRRFTKAFSPRHAKEIGGGDPGFFADEFVKAGRYTAGLTARYGDSEVVDAKGSVATGSVGRVVVGMRCPSAQVVRLCDAKAMQLARGMLSDGRWRVVIFGGDWSELKTRERMDKLATYLSSPTGPIHTYMPPSHDIDSLIDPVLVLHGDRAQIEQEHLHAYFWPVTGKYRIRDLHKTYVDDESYNSGHGHCYEHFGIDPENGVVLLVRPDNYVAKIVGLEDHEGIGKFFDGVFLRPESAGVNGSR